jgi:hypothetical protein
MPRQKTPPLDSIASHLRAPATKRAWPLLHLSGESAALLLFLFAVLSVFAAGAAVTQMINWS